MNFNSRFKQMTLKSKSVKCGPGLSLFTLAELEKASKEKYAQACVQRHQLRIAHVQLTGCHVTLCTVFV